MRKKIFLGLFILITGFFTYSLIAQISKAVGSTDRLNVMTNSLTDLQKENGKLRKLLVDVQTPGFIERQARDKLGLVRKGETIVIIPDEKIKQVLGLTKPMEQKKTPNYLGWWKLFFP